MGGGVRVQVDHYTGVSPYDILNNVITNSAKHIQNISSLLIMNWYTFSIFTQRFSHYDVASSYIVSKNLNVCLLKV